MDATLTTEAVDAHFASPTDAEEYDIDVRTFGTDPDDDLAAYVAEQLCLGFILHDRREYEAAVEAFYEVDRFQFPHLDDDEAYEAARALTDAFWAKDDVEEPHVDGSEVDPALEDADWSPVEDALRRRADVVGMPAEYATETVEAWRNHKTGGDYWTPTMVAQGHEISAAIGDPAYPAKPKFGQSGYGHLAMRYLVGLELHDMHTERHWREAAAVMRAYFAEILARQEASR